MSFRENFFYNHQAGTIAANTVIRSGPCTLHAVTINTTGATVGAITIADGVGGPTVAIITPIASTNPLTLIYDLRFVTAIVASGSGATMDVTFAVDP